MKVSFNGFTFLFKTLSSHCVSVERRRSIRMLEFQTVNNSIVSVKNGIQQTVSKYKKKHGLLMIGVNEYTERKIALDTIISFSKIDCFSHLFRLLLSCYGSCKIFIEHHKKSCKIYAPKLL